MQSKPRCPGLVIAASVLLIVYGSLMLVCGFCTGGVLAMMAVMPAMPQGQPDPFVVERAVQKELPSYLAAQIGIAVYNLLLAPTMIAAGLGALWLKPVARFVGSAAAFFDILIGLANALFMAVIVFPATDRVAAAQVNMPVNLGFTQQANWGQLIMAVGLSLAFCGPILAFLNVRRSRDAFAGKITDPPPDEHLERLKAFEEDDDHVPPSKPRKSSDDTGFSARPD